MKTTRKIPSITAGSLGEDRPVHFRTESPSDKIVQLSCQSQVGTLSKWCEHPSSTHKDHMQCENCFFLTTPLIQGSIFPAAKLKQIKDQILLTHLQWSYLRHDLCFPKIKGSFASKMDTPCQGNPLAAEDNTAILWKDNDSLFSSKKSYFILFILKYFILCCLLVFSFNFLNINFHTKINW